MIAITRDRLVDELVSARVESGASVGIVAGVVPDVGAATIGACGEAGEGQYALGSATGFELGSVAKVFTATLLAEMVERGEVALSDPVGDLLPASVTPPSVDGCRIRLVHLATHTSGLPRMPTNLQPADPGNPLADYTVDRLYEFLTRHELRRAPGAEYEYSNIGFGLLGHLLASRAGTSFAELLRERVLEPLGLADTSMEMSPSMTPRFARPHDERGDLAPRFDNPVLPGAGGLLSTIEDTLAFARANIAEPTDALTQAMHAAQRPRHRRFDGVRVGLGWHIRRPFERDIVWHSGETAGSRSFIALDPARRRAAVVLSNSAASVDDLGLHLLDERIELVPERRTDVAVAPDVLRAYVGVYDLGGELRITVTQSPRGLTAEATGVGRAPIHPESDTDFFIRPIKARLTFERDPDGEVAGVVFHYRGRGTAGKKVA